MDALSRYYYLLLFVISLCSTWWIFKKVLRIAKTKNIVDNPDERKLQRVPVPVLGGAAVFFGMIVSLAFAGILFNISDLLPLLCVMTIMLYIGTMDDIISLTPRTRFLIEVLCILLLIYGNKCSIDSFHGLWGIHDIPSWVGVPLTVFACVGIINSINMIDGVNGLCSGYCIIVCGVLGVFFIITGDVDSAAVAILSVGSLIPFFFHNVFGKASKMFIGDGGALLMGIIMSSLVINALKSDSSLACSVPENFGMVPFILALFSIPVFDTLRVMMARMLRGTSPFNPDKTHLHHLFLDLNFSHVGTSFMEIFINLMVVLVWYLSYLAGASIDVQLYIVIFSGILITAGFYRFGRVQIRRNGKFYRIMSSFGEKTHVGHKNWFKNITGFLDGEPDTK